MKLNTYLIFDGQCRQAMEFYKKCLGGDLMMMTFGEMPGDSSMIPKEAKDGIMHARLSIKSEALMASDTRPDLPFKPGDNFSISINCEETAEAEKLFKGLSEQGKIDMPLQETFWAERFGMLTDQFGIKWMINVEKNR